MKLVSDNIIHVSSARNGGEHDETAAGRQRAGFSYQDAAPAAVSGGIVEQLLLEDAARDLAAQLASIESPEAWADWRRSHQAILAAVHRLLPDCPAKRRMTAASGAAKARVAFTGGCTSKKAQARGEKPEVPRGRRSRQKSSRRAERP